MAATQLNQPRLATYRRGLFSKIRYECEKPYALMDPTGSQSLKRAKHPKVPGNVFHHDTGFPWNLAEARTQEVRIRLDERMRAKNRRGCPSTRPLVQTMQRATLPVMNAFAVETAKHLDLLGTMDGSRYDSPDTIQSLLLSLCCALLCAGFHCCLAGCSRSESGTLSLRLWKVGHKRQAT